MTIGKEERDALCEQFNKLLANGHDEAQLRRLMDSDSGYDRSLWASMSDMGLPALLVPPEHGGVGAGALEVGAVMEIGGAALLPSPLLASSVLATSAIVFSNDDAAKKRLLPDLASGVRIATLAATGDRGGWDERGIAVSASCQSETWTLDGIASYVIFGAQADVLIVAARLAEGFGLFEVSPDTPGVTRDIQQGFDRTLRLARISFKKAAATPISGGDSAFLAALDFGRAALAAEQAGAARKIFDLTVEYIRTRVQFGRPIGGFQAIKHMAADLLIEVESCISASRAAAEALADGSSAAEEAITLASFACSESFGRIAFDAIQMHGGIGFTYEHSAHLYLRRARSSAQLLGSIEEGRDQYISILEQAA